METVFIHYFRHSPFPYIANGEAIHVRNSFCKIFTTFGQKVVISQDWLGVATSNLEHGNFNTSALSWLSVFS